MGERCLTNLIYIKCRVLTCYVGVQYGMHEGTSQSAGFVAGAAALLLAAYRTAGINATGAMMKSPIMSGAQPLTQLKNRCKAGAGLSRCPAGLTSCSAALQTLVHTQHARSEFTR